MGKHSDNNFSVRIADYDIMNSSPFFTVYGVDPESCKSIEISENLFSVRVCNALLRSGIKSLGQLLNFSPYELHRDVNNIGRAFCH